MRQMLINSPMKISVIGTGYVGLVSAVGFSEKGHRVVCVDRNAEIVAKLNAGSPHFYEPGLADALQKVVHGGLLHARTDVESSVRESDMTFIAVGTPHGAEGIDLSQVRQAASQIGRALKSKGSFHTIVVKSTVVPGTTDSVVGPILQECSGLGKGEFGLAMSPEFLREGQALGDVRFPDRIVIGAEDAISREQLATLYSGWGVDLLFTNARTAEMIKYANNAFLAAQVSLSNEMANLCETIGGIDCQAVLDGVKRDHRWNPISSTGKRVNPPILKYLQNGCGYGGSCFPKDVQALVSVGRSAGSPMKILEAVHTTNVQQPLRVVVVLREGLGNLEEKKIVLFGLSFKPETDDVRESPALVVARALFEAGALVYGVDPKVRCEVLGAWRSAFTDVAGDWRDAVRDADAAVFLTAWPEYCEILPSELLPLMRGDLVIDGRGMLSHEEYQSECRYIRLGMSPRGPNPARSTG